MTPKKRNGHPSRFRQIWENLGVAAIVSLVISSLISGGIGHYFATRLENTKEQVTSLVRYKDQIDASQNKIIAELGIYGDRLIKNRDAAKVEELESAIITAQLQINRLRGAMRPDDQPLLKEYENELGNLLRQVRSTPGPNDMVPVLASAQKLLSIHDRFAERVRHNIEMTAFF